MVRLGSVAQILNGDRSSNYPSGDEFQDTGIPFINAGHLQGGKVDYSSMDYISYEKYNQLSGAKIQRNDILLCLRGSLGKYAFVTTDGGAPASSIAVIRPNTEKIDPDYLLQIIASSIFQKQIEVENNGSSQPNLSAKSVFDFVIPLPSLEEQRNIAATLNDTDALIRLLKNQLAKKKAIKQGAMQELLTGERRLPGYSMPWINKKLCEIAPLQRGLDLPYSKLENGHVPVIFSNGINAYHRVAMVKGPGVITGRSGTIGKLHYVDGDYWPHNTTLWVTDFKGNNPRFIYYLFNLVNWTDYMTGSGVPTLNRNDVHAKIMSIPENVEEQESIATALLAMDSEIEALEQKLAKYRQVKQGMMQQLLTGKIRLM
ncbi:restriction endonuclease subunit S [Oscillibacter hominis]|uniref:Restriction endonuclease subunit S n=1 Tax=Oscillibacter hominis TaxID=2763056 RepID=A0A7G9B6G0_9FIRM|nr:restriction endonuclease subunit S [Oscillibacter hominis]QNL45141.1 restriction endonuclease subunit S [Oscillibacter hominis]